MNNARTFYKTMLAKSVSKPFSGKDWIFEIKWDGFRAIAYVDEYFTVQSPNAKELKYFFPELEELRQLTKNVVVDGEIVTLKQGKVDFQPYRKEGTLNILSAPKYHEIAKALKKKEKDPKVKCKKRLQALANGKKGALKKQVYRQI